MSEEVHIVYPYNKTTRGEPRRKMMNMQKEAQVNITKGLLDVIVLQMLKNEPMHGYQIIAVIRKNYGVYLGPSTVYPRLSLLEKKGVIKGAWRMDGERPCKTYTITADGQALLDFAGNSLSLICRTNKRTTARANEVPMIVATAQKTSKGPSNQFLAH
jgi:DNA-binding PadR family transcriptional regulator